MNQMCVTGTKVEHYPEFGLWVKREDLSCPGGPYFSKTRGVYAHIAARPKAHCIGVLDTAHSQGGWAVARACQLLKRQCVLYYPVRKAEKDAELKIQQKQALILGAKLIPLQAGRSAVLYHSAKKHLATLYDDLRDDDKFLYQTYMMPNALKLPEMIEETVAEVLRTPIPPAVRWFIISASSGTIAAGVISGLVRLGFEGAQIIVHQGYDRGENAIRNYMAAMVAEYSNRLWEAGRHPHQGDDPDPNIKLWSNDFRLINEKYSYADEARPGTDPRWPCNKFYDLKAFRWWMRNRQERGGFDGEALLWNIG